MFLMDSVEFLILRNLLHNEEYIRKVIPFIKADYFEDMTQKIVFEEISSFVEQYNKPATKEILCIEAEKRSDINDSSYKDVTKLISSLENEPSEFEWLIVTTEKWCRDRAIYNALLESIQIADGEKKASRDAIPSLLTDALAVSFDNSVGHDYIDDADDRFDFNHRKEEKIPFDISMLNKITKGGLGKKTLNIALAGTGVGKSLFMCHTAASHLMQGYNVLYITCEMAEEKIAERIDANLLNINVQQLETLPKVMYDNKMTKVAEKTQGRLIVKEYPTAAAHVGHFKSLLQELAIKKSFTPDVVFVDYLNICASARYKGAIVNSYTYVKAIAEELRGLAAECNLPIISATQTTRSGYGNSDVELTDTSESFGLPATADFMFALISSEDLEANGQIMIKQLKNRYNDPTMNKRFVVGIDRGKMRLYDCDQQENIIDPGHNGEDTPKIQPTLFQDFKV